MTFYYYNQRLEQFIEVPNAKEIKLEGYEDLTFFVYRDKRREWCVVEAKSGFHLWTHGHTQKAIYEAVISRMREFKISQLQLKSIIWQQIKKTGESPCEVRYDYLEKLKNGK